jgi:CBS domain-containing protein
VVLAGPAVNVVIAAVLFFLLQMTNSFAPLNQLSATTGPFMERLMMVNLFLVLFNMLPAFPMDGGRVLRALLAMQMDYLRATQIAANLGQGMALLFGFTGLFNNPFLLFIALLIWIGASQEAGMVQMKASLGGIPVERAMPTDFRQLTPHDSLSRAIELILAGSQQDFPVVDKERVIGVLTGSDLLMALAQQGQHWPVTEVMKREFQVVDSSEMLETAFQRLQTNECHTLPVVHKGQLVGLVTTDNIGEFLMIQSAVDGAKGKGRTCWQRMLRPASSH